MRCSQISLAGFPVFYHLSICEICKASIVNRGNQTPTLLFRKEAYSKETTTDVEEPAIRESSLAGT